MAWHYHNPVEITFGPGALEDLPALAAGRSIALVTFPEAAELGLSERIERLVGTNLADVPIRRRAHGRNNIAATRRQHACSGSTQS